MNGRRLPRTAALAFIAAAFLQAACRNADPEKLVLELMPLENEPMVAIQILVKAGSACDPSGKEGLARLTWGLLAEGGSRLKSAVDIRKALRPLAAGLSLTLDKETAVFSGLVHRDNLEAYYAVIRDMLCDPGFRRDDFDRLRSNRLDLLEKTWPASAPEFLAREILQALIYRDHPYGRPEPGTVESVSGMRVEESRAFYREHFVQGNLVIGLAGGFPADFPDRVRADFERLPSGFTPRLAPPAPPPIEGLECGIAESPARTAVAAIGFPVDLTRRDRRFFALWIAAAHLGESGRPFGRLSREIGDRRGLGGGVSVFAEHAVEGRDGFPEAHHARSRQYFSILLPPVESANRLFVIRLVLRELARLRDEGMAEERFALVRSYLLNSLDLRAQTLEERLGARMDSRFFGLEDFLDEARKVLPRLTRDDVQSAIREYLDPDNACVAVVTPEAEAFKNDWLSNAPSPPAYRYPPEAREVIEEDRAIRIFPLDARPEAVRLKTAAAWFHASR